MTIPILTDYSDLTVGPTGTGTEVILNTSGAIYTIEIPVAGNVTATTRVALRALYVAKKAYWLATAGQFATPFPWSMTTKEIGTLRNNWEFKADTDRKKVALGGWQEVTTDLSTGADGAAKQKWLGALAGYPSGVPDTHQCYYSIGGATPVNFTYAGAVAEPIKYYGDATHGNFDYSASDVAVYARHAQYLYSSATIFGTYVGTTALGNELYRLALSVSADPKMTATDLQIDPNSDGVPEGDWAGITLTRGAASTAIAMNGGTYNFRWIVDCNGKSPQVALQAIRFLERQSADIDSGTGTLNGKLCPDVGYFVGDRLVSRQIASGEGVAFTNYPAAYKNNLGFVDDTGVERSFAYVAAFTIYPSVDAIADAATHYAVYKSADWEPGASPLNDFDSVPIEDDLDGASSASYAVDYSALGGDTPCVLVMGGFDRAQISVTYFTITQSDAITVQANCPKEIVV